MKDFEPREVATADQNYARARRSVDHLVNLKLPEQPTDFDTVVALSQPIAHEMAKIHDLEHGVYSAMILAAELLRRLRAVDALVLGWDEEKDGPDAADFFWRALPLLGHSEPQ